MRQSRSGDASGSIWSGPPASCFTCSYGPPDESACSRSEPRMGSAPSGSRRRSASRAGRSSPSTVSRPNRTRRGATSRRPGSSRGVTFLAGDATEVVRGLPGPFDAVFFDADRVSAPEQLALLLPRLEPDVLLVSDNVLSHPAEVAAYLAACDALSGFASSSCPWERVYTSRTGRHADRAARPDKIPSPPSSAGRSSRLRFKGLGAARTSQGLDLAIRRALDLEGRRRCPGLVKRLRLRVS